MFKIADKVVDKNGKVFEIVTIEDKDFGLGKEPYFILKPYFAYDFNPGYQVFIPVSKSESLLRYVIDKEEAIRIIDSIESLETYHEVSPRERKVYFTKVVNNGDLSDLIRVIKTLIEYREERLKINKPFSDFDKRLLQNLTNLLNSEFSLALSIPVDEVSYFILKRTGISL